MDFQIVIGPRLANCPKHSSKKKIGTPQISASKYRESEMRLQENTKRGVTSNVIRISIGTCTTLVEKKCLKMF